MNNANARIARAPKTTLTPIPAFVPVDSPGAVVVVGDETAVDEVVGGMVDEVGLELDVELGRSEDCQLICIRGA
jgi:hypothetical protein